MKINPVNNVQPRLGNQKGVENKNKYYNKNIPNPKTKLFATLSIGYTLAAFDNILDGFNNLTKTQKAGRVAKWAAIISACSSLTVFVASFSVTDFIQKSLNKRKEDKNPE